ncbi:MAG TPA: DNA mismatch repair endonuclease MutL [Planctomycetota bacterium]|nr:DNA mismatch repair endonuclease MutL [Planctomycetota bacterium]
MARIHVLPTDVQNRIAAGEVIERPASVLKELVENALDAGARHIDVEIQGGGRDLIRVHDDGSGIAAADLPVAILRHATSKIETADDIYAVSTLGFRGEALPSIGSVSLLTITSRCPGDDSAHAIHIEGGTASAVELASGNPGTTVTVRRLFYNLPARLKFLKSDPGETAACLQTLTRLALCWPHCSFQLKTRAANGRDKRLLDVGAALVADGSAPAAHPADLLRTRLEDLYGPEDARQLLPFAGYSGEPNSPRFLAATGFAGSPTLRHPNRSRIQLFLNRRPIKDAALVAAVTDAYRGLLPDKTFPVAFLFLEIHPSEIDVNVHPTKEQIRFRDPGRLYGFLKQTLQNLHRQSGADVRQDPAAAPSTPALTPAPALGLHAPPSAPPAARLPFQYPAQPFAPLSAADATAPRHIDLRALTDRIPTSSPARTPGSHADAIPFTAGVSAQEAAAAAPAASSYEPLGETVLYTLRETAPGRIQPVLAATSPAGQLAPDASAAPAATTAVRTPWRAIGQWQQAFIVAEAEDRLWIIDQHALHERVMFERLRRQVEQGPVDSQPFLMPQPVRLTPVQHAVADVALEPLRELGLQLENFGADTLLLRSAPIGVSAELASRVVIECIDEALESGVRRADRMTLRRKLVNRMSCVAAIKAGDGLTLPQMQALLDEYAQWVGVTSFTCPHGRPIAMEIKREAIERAVGRT